MILLRNHSIKQRLTYIIMAVSCTSVFLTTLAISIIGVSNMKTSILSSLEQAASIVGANNNAGLSFDQHEDIATSLRIFSEYKDITQACVYDAKVYKIQDNEPPLELMNVKVGQYSATSNCPDDLTRRTIVTKDRIEIMKPIVNAGDTIGYIYLESTLEQIDAYIKKQTAIAFTVTMAALLVSYFLAINLQHAISRPILSLADTARRVSREQDYSIRAEQIGDPRKEANNELVILTASFNTMLTEIGARDDQLKTQNVALEKAKDAAESANRAKSQFLANISHELRTPLNAIIGFSSILMNQLFGPLGDQKYLEYSKDINESGAHLLDIINDILDLSKAEAGKLELAYEEVHIGKAINKALTILGERISKAQLQVNTDIPKMLPPLVADRLRLIQILLNIVSNAVKFTAEGGKIDISVKIVEENGAPSQSVITIQDTGIGMAQEDIEKAFQSFGQVDSGLNRKYEGTGLGLPLTQKLMEAHYGSIAISSEENKGTLVTLTFPLVPPPEAGYEPEE